MNKDKLDKKIAKEFIRIYKKKASIEDLLYFVELVFSQSELYKEIKKPAISKVMKINKKDNPNGDLGSYDNETHTIYISDIYENKIKKQVKGQLGDFLDTYCHEATHHLQNEMNLEIKERAIGKEEMSKILRSVGYEDNKNMASFMAYAQYLNLSHEKEARTRGRDTALEIFKNLSNNKYIKKNVDAFMFLESEEEDYSKKSMNDSVEENSTLENYKYSIKRWDPLLKAGKMKMEDSEYIFTFYEQMRMKCIDDNQIEEDYFNVAILGGEAFDAKFVMDRIIKSKNVNQNVRNNLRRKIGNLLFNGGNNGVNKEEEYPGLFDFTDYDYIFSENDYKAIFAGLLYNHVDKINAPLILCQTERISEFMASELLKCKENNMLNFKNEKDLESFKEFFSYLVEIGQNKIDVDVKNQLEEYACELGIRDNKKEAVISSRR